MESLYSADNVVLKAQADLPKSAFLVSFLAILGFAVSFLTQVVLAAVFGAGAEMDAYLAASTLPVAINMIVAGVSTQVLVPAFIRKQVQSSSTLAWRLASNVLTLTCIGLTLLIVLAELFAPYLTCWTVPGLAHSTSYTLVINLQRLLFPITLFAGIASFGSSIYYTQHKFLVPSLLPVINTISILSTTLMLESSLGIYSIALGVIAGTLVQCMIVLPLLRKNYCFERIRLSSDCVSFLKLAVPYLLTAIITQGYSIVERRIASQFPSGSISALGYANRIITVFAALSSQGISASLFPLLCRYAAKEHREEFAHLVTKGITVLLMILLPALVFLGIFRVEFVALVLQRGRFDRQATLVTAGTLLSYLGVALALGIGAIQVNALYALQRTSTVAWIAANGLALYMVVGPILASFYSVYGIALAYSLAVGVNSIILMWLLYRSDALNARRFVVNATKILGASALTALFLTSIHSVLESWWSHNSVGTSLIAIICALGIYLGILTLWGLEEVATSFAFLCRGAKIVKGRLMRTIHRMRDMRMNSTCPLIVSQMCNCGNLPEESGYSVDNHKGDRKVTVVLVNINQKRDTLECIESLYKTNYKDLEVILVDNGSKDGSPEAIESQFPEVLVIRTYDNLGFTVANNIGISEALRRGAEYLLILNNDTIVDEHVIEELLAPMKRDFSVGMTVLKMYFYDRPRVISFAGGWVDRNSGQCVSLGYGEPDHGQFNTQLECGFAPGCGVLVRKGVLEAVGMFWSPYFIYYEDVEWSVRARDKGYRIIYVPSAMLWHKVSTAFGSESPYLLYLMSRNRLFFVKRNRERGKWLYSVSHLTVHYTRWIAFYALKRRSTRQSLAILKGVWDFFLGRTGRARERDLSLIA